MLTTFSGCLIICLQSSLSAEETNGAAAFVKNYPARAKQLFASLNPTYPGMSKVDKALKQHDQVAACKALLNYFKHNQAGSDLRDSESIKHPKWANGKKNMNPDDMIKDKFTIKGITAVIPRDAAGHLKWNYIPPNGYKQYPTMLARFSQGQVAWNKYLKTGKVKYAKFVNDHILDWIAANPYMKKRVSDFKAAQCFDRPESHPNPNYTWFTLHSSVRLKAITKLFYFMIDDRNIPDSTKLLLLSSIEEHLHYMYHRAGMRTGNKGIFTMENLLYAAVHFPEFKNAAKWRQAAIQRVTKNISKCVWPDGAEDELALMYSFGILNAEFDFIKLVNDLKLKPPAEFLDSVKRQLFFLAVCCRPDGKLFPHGDSDTETTKAPKLAEFAAELEEPEVLYISTNGKKGTKPADPPSRFFNYSGFGISRDHWRNTKLWSFFDAGPYGSAHAHADKLQFCVYNRRMILIDPGKYRYSDKGGWTPEYYLATRGHNTIMLDDHDQNMYLWYKETGPNDEAYLRSRKMIATGPISPKLYEITPTFDRFSGKVEVGYRKGAFYKRRNLSSDKGIPKLEIMKGKASHERTVYFKRGHYWLIFDRIRGDHKRQVNALWHFHPDCSVKKLPGGRIATTDPGKGNLLIVPATGGIKLKPELVKGKGFQGWYSPKTNVRVPTWCADYSGESEPNGYFAWLMLPFDGKNIPGASAGIISADEQKVKIEVKIGNNKPETIEFPVSI